MITAQSVQQGLTIFYLIGAIMLLALAIIVYPTLRDRGKKSRKSSK